KNEDVAAYLNDVADYWMEETDIDGYTLHAADQYDPAFLQDLTSKIKEKHPNFYLIATALQEDAQVDLLFDNEDLDAISNPEMYEAINDLFIRLHEPITNILQIYQNRDDDSSLLI